MRSSSEHLLMLVNDILDYSKIESGKLRLEEIGFKTQTVISESMATLEHMAQTKKLELRQELDPKLKDLVLLGDPIRLKQILINLAGNGVKFTDTGYVKITATLDRQRKGKATVKFSVEDTGKGIELAKLQKDF
ncbi:MAG: ATP-binding protein [Owenweeksia sp.]|nr:ATP-binding protein [Owenweeksia sp.]